MGAVAFEHWPDRLQRVLDDIGGPWRRVCVIGETPSTQDAAVELNAEPGDIVTAWRQTAGRGRRGRSWADTTASGIAVTFVTEAGSPPRLAVSAAVGTALAAERILGRPVGIKWPNDIVAGGRKLAGVLVEQIARRALIGIGVNVAQTVWPPALAGRAVSLAELGAAVDRVDAVAALLDGMSRALGFTEPALGEAFATRDVLAGTRATFRTPEKIITGTVLRIDPLRGLLVEADGSRLHLSAETTTVVSDEG
jgi:BirA family biotin operon repressor/biotin-[acetyl-CoA-carboxylase] ligase